MGRFFKRLKSTGKHEDTMGLPWECLGIYGNLWVNKSWFKGTSQPETMVSGDYMNLPQNPKVSHNIVHHLTSPFHNWNLHRDIMGFWWFNHQCHGDVIGKVHETYKRIQHLLQL